MAINTQVVYTEPEYFLLRKQMVECQLSHRDIRDPRVLRAMMNVPRHFFVPGGFCTEAYDDRPLPIGCGQTISQPYIVAKVAELLELRGPEKVLEVGGGCGYQAAILGALSREVISLERHLELSEAERQNLVKAGMDNVSVVTGDGKEGYVPGAPYDRLVVSCATPEFFESWTRQLAADAIAVYPLMVGETQVLTRRRRTRGQWLAEERIFEVRFVPLK